MSEVAHYYPMDVRQRKEITREEFAARQQAARRRWQATMTQAQVPVIIVPWGSSSVAHGCVQTFDALREWLTEHGIEHGFVNLGGDVRAIGAQPDGNPWRIGLQHPRRMEAVVGTVEMRDAAVATSGDYARYFEFEGRRYCHLLDARTGRPVDAWQSASVIAPLAILAGSQATIAMLLGAAAVSFLDAQGADYLLVAADGSIRHSDRAVVLATSQTTSVEAHTCTDARRA